MDHSISLLSRDHDFCISNSSLLIRFTQKAAEKVHQSLHVILSLRLLLLLLLCVPECTFMYHHFLEINLASNTSSHTLDPPRKRNKGEA